MIRFGIIGLGKMGRIRAREIEARSDASLVAAYDVREEAFEAFPALRRSRSVDELLESDVDAVVIAAYNNVAAPYTIKALRAGKHVLCEKPPALSSAQLEEVAKAHRDSGCVLKYGFNHRYHHSVMEAKKLADSQAFGELLWIKGTYGKAGGANYESSWRSQPEYSGGGILIDQGIHMLDLMRLFAGDIQNVRGLVQSRYWNTPVEDNVFALMEAGDVPMMLHSSVVHWRHRFILEVCYADGLIMLDGLQTPTGSYGDETLILIRRQFEDSSFALGKPREERIYFDQDPSWRLELEELIQAITGNTPVLNGSVSDAIQLMRVIEQIYEVK